MEVTISNQESAIDNKMIFDEEINAYMASIEFSTKGFHGGGYSFAVSFDPPRMSISVYKSHEQVAFIENITVDQLVALIKCGQGLRNFCR